MSVTTPRDFAPSKKSTVKNVGNPPDTTPNVILSAGPTAGMSPYPIYRLSESNDPPTNRTRFDLNRVYDGIRPVTGQYEARFRPISLCFDSADSFLAHLRNVYSCNSPFWFTFELGASKEQRLVRAFLFPLHGKRFSIEYESRTQGIYRVAIDPRTLENVNGEVRGALRVGYFIEVDTLTGGVKKPADDEEDTPSKTVAEARAKKGGKTTAIRQEIREHLVKHGRATLIKSGGAGATYTNVLPSDADTVLDAMFTDPPAKPTPAPGFYDDDFVRPSGDGMLTIRKPGRFVGER
jgi:hypothetical protein